MEQKRYDFENLEVYQLAMEFTDQIFALTDNFPQRIQYSLGDQLRRAALSICNNLAEGSQKRGLARKQFYGYSLGSSRECVPMLELAKRRKLIDDSEHKILSDKCFHISGMIYRLIQNSQ